MAYIDKEKAQIFLRTECLAKYPISFANGLLAAADQLNKLPTTDVVEVRHGKAICGDHDEWWGAVYECSLCGEKWMLESSSYKAHYCPWCGAKMDEERKEAEMPFMGHLW